MGKLSRNQQMMKKNKEDREKQEEKKKEDKELALHPKDPDDDGGESSTSAPAPAPAPVPPPAPVRIPSLPNGNPPTDAQTLQAIIDDNANANDNDKNKKDFLYENGFRTEFGTRKTGQHETEIETNYLEITRRPKKIYVYRIVMVREYEDEKNEDGTVKKKKSVPVYITRRNQKEGVFQFIEQHTPRLLSQKSWATDFDLIWSAIPLFKDNDATFVPAALGQVDVHCPITEKPVTAENVEIKFDRTLDLEQGVARLFRKQTGSAAPATDEEEEEDSDVLTRGINAFVSRFSKKSDGLTSTNANTIYINNTAEGLDEEKLFKVLRGYFISLRPGSQSLILNINVKHPPFFNPYRVDLWMGKCHDYHDRTVRETRGYLIGKTVRILGERKSVHAPSGNGIITEVGLKGQQKPEGWGDYGVLRNLRINIGSKKTKGGLNGPEYFPASELELCDNQPFRGILTGDQTTAMLEQACKRPKVNKAWILDEGLRTLGISDDTGRKAAAAFGLEISQKLMKIPARLLGAPTPQYLSGSLGTNGTPPVKLAGWNLVQVRLFNIFKLPRLAVLDLRALQSNSGAGSSLSGLETATKEAFEALGIAGTGFSLDVRTPQLLPGQDMKVAEDELKTLVTATLQEGDNARPVLVLLPQHDYDLYSRLKRVFDLVLGTQSVCASTTKFVGFGGKDKNDRTKGVPHMSNIGLKVNLKTAGDNQRLVSGDLKDILTNKTSPVKAGGVDLKVKVCETIILGADVAHPTASAVPGCPSIASVVGSTDDNFVKYPGSMRLQGSRQEFIANLDDMAKERLLDWAANHGGRLPKAVLFYRDGVSESQYDAVRFKEIPQLQTAFKLAYSVLHPSKKASQPTFNLTSIVVGKRHNTRFYAPTKEDTFTTKVKREDGQPGMETITNWNVKPGIVIDKKITHPYSNDFFLQSHEPLQGTGRSAHYFVLTNQMRFPADELQKITHSLCYIYARATKGVSYCAPAYYADRLCDRGRAYLRPWLINNEEGLAVDRDQNETLEEFKDRIVNNILNGGRWVPAANKTEELKKYGDERKNPWHPSLDDTMFYL